MWIYGVSIGCRKPAFCRSTHTPQRTGAYPSSLFLSFLFSFLLFLSLPLRSLFLSFCTLFLVYFFSSHCLFHLSSASFSRCLTNLFKFAVCLTLHKWVSTDLINFILHKLHPKSEFRKLIFSHMYFISWIFSDIFINISEKFLFFNLLHFLFIKAVYFLSFSLSLFLFLDALPWSGVVLRLILWNIFDDIDRNC